MAEVIKKPLCELILEKLLAENIYAIEIQNASLSIIVGLVFFIDRAERYNRFPNTYQYMDFAPAWFWGVLYFSLGAFHLVCLFTGLRYLRKQVLLAKSALWVFIGICVFFANPYIVTGYFYFTYALFALWGFLRIQVLKTEVWKNGH